MTGFPDVYLTLLDGRAPLKPGGGTEEIHNMLPAISPNGNRIAYTSTRGSSNGHWDIWVADRDGRNLQNLTPNTPNSTESAPTWSPSGTQLAFTSDRVGSNQIYIMNVDGTGVQKITAEKRTDRPSWSSQNYIAYSTERPAGNDVAVFDIATGRNVVVTDGLGSNEGPIRGAQRPAHRIRHDTLGARPDRRGRLPQSRQGSPHHRVGHQHVPELVAVAETFQREVARVSSRIP